MKMDIKSGRLKDAEQGREQRGGKSTAGKCIEYQCAGRTLSGGKCDSLGFNLPTKVLSKLLQIPYTIINYIFSKVWLKTSISYMEQVI